MRNARSLACTFAVLLWAAGVYAAAPPALLTGYNLTSWTQKDGLTNSLIWSIEQDTEGYLWLGTDAGALRFDGVRVVPWDALMPVPRPSASVRTISIARDGAIWFGLGEPGGIVVAQGSQVRAFGVSEGVPEGVVMALTEDSRGTMWAAGRFGVVRFDGRAWQRQDEGLGPGLVNTVQVDGASLLAGTNAGVFRWTEPGTRWSRVGAFADSARSIAPDHTGRLWVADPSVGLRALDNASEQPAAGLRGRGSWLMRDTRGHLWVGTGGQGLFRLRSPDGPGASPVLERTSTATGLSDDGVTDLEEDRDGNIWVATRDGLNRLTPHRMTPITDVGVVSAVDATTDGRVWVGSAADVMWFRDGRLDQRSAPLPLPEPPLAAMHADEHGTLWVATARQLFRVAGDSLRRVPLTGGAVAELTDITSDARGGLWLHDSQHGLFRWRDGHLTPGPLPPALDRATLLASYTDSTGRAWFSFDQERVAMIDPSGRPHLFGANEGLSAGSYRAIHEDRGGTLWFGGDRGLTRYVNGTFATVAGREGAAFQRITGIVDAEAGALWLAIEASGLVRVSRAEIDAALTDPSHRLAFNAFDKVDGSAGTSRWFGSRTAARSADGRLWFVAGRGITVVDPVAIGAGTPDERAVRIEGATADGRALSTATAQALAPGTARVQIDYTILDLTSPQKRRFRHRLDGFDTDWVEAGTRHAAFYTNLSPRSYTFRVMASGPDGVFPGSASEWAFTVRPAFYQTWWFAVAAVGLVALLVAGAWRMHVLRMRRQFALLVGERARLSREVHDTLLQSMFGYALQFDALAQIVPASDAHLRVRLAQLRHQVEDDIREARQSIWNLRSPQLEQQDLAGNLRRAAELAGASRNVAVSMTVEGTPVRGAATTEEQVLRIGREAVANVLRHAEATRVHLHLQYEGSRVTLVVSDDGKGFDPASPAGTDHFGLTTMRERAESVGGTLHITSAPGAGTTVTATVPLP